MRKTLDDRDLFVNKIKFFSLRVRPWGMLNVAGMVMIVMSLIGFFGKFWWFFDLADQFRIQYVLGFAFLAGLHAVFRKGIQAFVYILSVVPNAALLVPFYFSEQIDMKSLGGSSYSALLINVNTESGDPDLVVGLVEQSSPDFVVFEEINDRWLERLVRLHPQYPYRVALPREDNFGIAFSSRLEPSLMKIISIGVSEAPSVIASYEINGETITILGTHPVPPYGGQYSAWRNAQ